MIKINIHGLLAFTLFAATRLLSMELSEECIDGKPYDAIVSLGIACQVLIR